MGNSNKQVITAKKYIEGKIGRITRESSLYQTAAWGNTDQPDFINQVIIAETRLEAGETMNIILNIEEKMGRIRTVKNASRVIDIDILFFNKDIIQTPTLTVPHPFIRERRFVLVPLNELSPLFIHPVLNKRIKQLLNECADELVVKKI